MAVFEREDFVIVKKFEIYGLDQSDEEKKKIMNSEQKHEARNCVMCIQPHEPCASAWVYVLVLQTHSPPPPDL